MHSTTALLLLMTLGFASSHPQCLDFTFPFKPAKPLAMCREYRDFGCCSRDADQRLIESFVRIIALMSPEERQRCTGYVRTLLCQKCSPYAAHIFDAEDSPTARTFPGLCPYYCNTMLAKCPSIVTHFTNDSALLSHMARRNYTALCAATTTSDPDYCYPDLKSNPDLSDNLGTAIFYQPNGKCIPICLEEITKRRQNPLSLKHSKDGTHRLFVVEQIGLIWIYLPDKSRLDPPFLDLRDLVVANKMSYDERGMLDIAFHPNFKHNGCFFLYYSFASRRKEYVKISEMKVSDNNMNSANISTERTLLLIKQPAANHNGGQLLFLDGIDENLYIFTGDGGRAGDPFGPHGNGQNKKTLLGKVLRIDVNSRGPNGLPYAISPDNPFVHDTAYRPEIYALGVRNMWRCSMDRGDEAGVNRGRIFCGDVGQSRYEEVDIIQRGGNYGWRGYEGNYCYDKDLCTSEFIKNYIPPIHAYSHSVGKSVTGGYVYRGCQNPNLKGKYIFGDFFNGKLFALTEDPNGTWRRQSVCMASSRACKGDALQNTHGKYILSFGENEDGELYMMSSTTALPGSRTGSVYKIVDPAGRGDPSECIVEMMTTTISPGTSKIPYQGSAEAENVQIRLANGGGSHQGRVEVLMDGEWGTICDDHWDLRDANVVCRMLGFAYAVRALKLARFGSGSGQVWLDEVQCSGRESNIGQCTHAGWGNHDCDHLEDASVACKTTIRDQTHHRSQAGRSRRP